MIFNIKNMVCNRCIMVVEQTFKTAGFENVKVQLGKVEVETEISENELDLLNLDLQKVGFEIINDQTAKLVEQIKNITVEYVYYKHGNKNIKFSHILASKLNRDYNYLSAIYSSVEGTTIEKHLINLKIERVKELLVYNETTLSEIAYEMGYSSVAHLSGQFKKVTGFTPSYFKQLGEKKRKSIDNI